MLFRSAFCTVEAVVYAFFTTAMPRSGGDYVFQSRILGGAWASIFAFSAVTLSQVIWMALAGWLGANIILSPFLTLLGQYYGSSWMIQNGAWWQTNWGIFTMGVIIVAWSAFVNIRSGFTYNTNILSPNRTGGGGTVSVILQPNAALTYPTFRELDLNVDKAINLGGGRRVVLQAAIFNVTNNNTVFTIQTRQNSATANNVTSVLAPRVARLGVRINF